MLCYFLHTFCVQALLVHDYSLCAIEITFKPGCHYLQTRIKMLNIFAQWLSELFSYMGCIVVFFMLKWLINLCICVHVIYCLFDLYAYYFCVNISGFSIYLL